MTFHKKFVIFLLILILLSPFAFTTPKNKKVRQFLTTGPWYPQNLDELNRTLENFFNKAQTKPIQGEIVGLIGPHAGMVYSGQCAANAYLQLEKRPDLERIIIMGVSHRSDFYGAVVSDFDFDGTPLGEIPIDTEVTAKLAKEKYFSKNNSIIQNEHSIEVHLPFLQFIQKKTKNTRYKIVPILFGYLEQKDFKPVADIIKKYITPKTLIIASSDFTHYGANYGYAPFKNNVKDNLTRLDMGMVDLIKMLDFKGYWDYKKKTGITMCGFIPVGIMMNIFQGDNAKYAVTLTDYYKSGDMNNKYDDLSVSYVSMIISKSLSVSIAPEKKTLLTLARHTLENYFQGKTSTKAEIESKYNLSPYLKEKAGVFVTLREGGELRGCIGNIIGVYPLWEGVQSNALNAAFKDPRFSPLQKKELDKVDIEISVMTLLQKLNDYKKIRLGVDGVIIKKDFAQAVFLPQVATETGWNLDKFLENLCMKAGLSSDEYKSEGMEFYIFQATIFSEKEHGK